MTALANKALSVRRLGEQVMARDFPLHVTHVIAGDFPHHVTQVMAGDSPHHVTQVMASDFPHHVTQVMARDFPLQVIPVTTSSAAFSASVSCSPHKHRQRSLTLK